MWEANNISASTEHNNEKDKLLHLSYHFSLFLTFHCCLSVVSWPEEGDSPEISHRIVYVLINKRSFESFMCLDHFRISAMEGRGSRCGVRGKHCDKVLDVPVRETISFPGCPLDGLLFGCQRAFSGLAVKSNQIKSKWYLYCANPYSF